MKRKSNALLPIEVSILQAGVEIQLEGENDFYGFLVAKRMKDRAHARLLTSYGTLYKALARLAAAGLVDSWWEDPSEAARANRLRRRLYRMTALGEAALRDAQVHALEVSTGFATEPAGP